MKKKRAPIVFPNENTLESNGICDGMEAGQAGYESIGEGQVPEENFSETGAVIVYLFTTVFIIAAGAIVYYLL